MKKPTLLLGKRQLLDNVKAADYVGLKREQRIGIHLGDRNHGREMKEVT